MLARTAARGGGHPGARRRPPLQDTDTRHGVTGPSTDPAPNRDRIADAAVSTAISAPRHRPLTSGTLTSTPAVTATSMNHTHTACSRPAKTRSQPRTVVGGTDRRSAIRRCPDPTAFPASATHTSSAAYALRSNNVTGSSTCVTRQARHRARRGCTGSATPTTRRGRA